MITEEQFTDACFTLASIPEYYMDALKTIVDSRNDYKALFIEALDKMVNAVEKLDKILEVKE